MACCCRRHGPEARRRMRIAIVSSGSGSKGGGEIYLRFLAEGLWKVGHQVVALIPDKPVMDDLASSLEPFASIERITYIPTYDRRLRTAELFLTEDSGSVWHSS